MFVIDLECVRRLRLCKDEAGRNWVILVRARSLRRCRSSPPEQKKPEARPSSSPLYSTHDLRSGLTQKFLWYMFFDGIITYIRTDPLATVRKLIYTIGQEKMTEIYSYTACRQLSQMAVAIIFFHSSEYILALAIHGRSNVTLHSLLISKSYLLAMLFSLVEYVTEIVLFPEWKEQWVISNLGLAMVVIGEIIRKMAIITAGQAFTHVIRIHHEERHQMITHGIYKFIRHPGYAGFFIWSIGTQIMLCNPMSTIAFAAVVWHFFAKRIPYEEFFLRQFFGRQYVEYSRQVVSGVPFVKWRITDSVG